MMRATTAFTAVLFVSFSAAAQVFDDGGAHTVNGASPGVTVGARTRVNIVAPAVVSGGAEAPFGYRGSVAVTARGVTGGPGMATISGGELRGDLLCLPGGQIRVSGGRVSGSAVMSNYDGHPFVEITGGTFTGGARSAPRSLMRVWDGSFGALPATTTGFTDVSIESSGGGTIQVAGGSFREGLFVGPYSVLIFNGGSVHFDDLTRPVFLGTVIGVLGDAVLYARAGRFNGQAIFGPGSRGRIAGGQWRFNRGSDFLPVLYSLQLIGTDDRPTRLEVFGGSFERYSTDGTARGPTTNFASRGDTFIDLYVSSMDIPDALPGFVAGFLADGSRIDVSIANYRVHFPLLEADRIQEGIDLISVDRPALVDLLAPQFPTLTIEGIGVPIDSFDFGGNIGRRTLDNVDAIIRRGPVVAPPKAPFIATEEIELLAMQMASTAPVDLTPFGLQGRSIVYLTLQSRRDPQKESPGKASKGTRAVNFMMREFDSTLDVYFDVRAGSLAGPIIFSDHAVITTTYPSPWGLQAAAGASDLPELSRGFYPGVIAGSAAPVEFSGGAFRSLQVEPARRSPKPIEIATANAIDLKSWRPVTVTIMSSKSFDASALNPRLVGIGPNGAPAFYERRRDVNGDKQPDLELQFLAPLSGLTSLDRSVCVLAYTPGGDRFTGCAPVQTR